MRKPTDNSQALTAFVARKAAIDSILARLAALSAEHFDAAPDAVNWGHVGTLESYLATSERSATRRSTRARPERTKRPDLILARAFCATHQEHASLDNLLSPLEQRELAKIATLLEYQTGGIAIFAEGEDAHFLYLISDGIMRLSRHLPDGARQVLGFMWPGDPFGLAEEGRYINSAECLTRTTLFSDDSSLRDGWRRCCSTLVITRGSSMRRRGCCICQ